MAKHVAHYFTHAAKLWPSDLVIAVANALPT